MVTVIFVHQKYSLPCTNILGFFACRVTSKVLRIGAAERSWGDVKTIKSGKISAIISDVSQKQSIFNTSEYIESSRTKQYHSDRQLNDNCSSHTWNEEDDDFDKQLEKWGVGKVFSNQSEPVKRELRAYIEDWEKQPMKKNYQRTCTRFLARYGGLYIYDIDFWKRYTIDDEDTHFVKGDGYAFIGNQDHPDGTSTYNEYSCIHYDLFGRILETDQNSNIILKVIHKETSFSSIN